jgi:hypothetical protein
MSQATAAGPQPRHSPGSFKGERLRHRSAALPTAEKNALEALRWGNGSVFQLKTNFYSLRCVRH